MPKYLHAKKKQNHTCEHCTSLVHQNKLKITPDKNIQNTMLRLRYQNTWILTFQSSTPKSVYIHTNVESKKNNCVSVTHIVS